MSEREMKYSWFQNWKRAKENFRAFLQKNQNDSAIFWEEVAVGIEIGYFHRFGERFGVLLNEIYG